MRSRSRFIGGLVLLFAFFVMVEYQMPHRFSWNPTYSHRDAQPLGCQLFDSVMSASLPLGYTVENRTPWQLLEDSTFIPPKSILYLAERISETDADNIMKLAGQGHTALVAVTNDLYLCDTLGIDYRRGWWGDFKPSNYIGRSIPPTIVRFQKDSLFYVVESMNYGYFKIPDSVDCQVLADASAIVEKDSAAQVKFPPEPDYIDTVAVSFSVGKGRIILFSMPMHMTNYGILHPEAGPFIAKMMSQVAQNPVVRIDRSEVAQREQSVFYVLLGEPPLRWALYLVLTSIVLFCVFTARRRQRVVPVISPPQNRSLEFVKLIGTLHYQDGFHSDLLKKKLAYTAEEIRRVTGIDILDDDSDDYEQLARIAGRDPQQMRVFLRNARKGAQGQHLVTEAELKLFVDELNNISKNL